jgi:hypothetical protein
VHAHESQDGQAVAIKAAHLGTFSGPHRKSACHRPTIPHPDPTANVHRLSSIPKRQCYPPRRSRRLAPQTSVKKSTSSSSPSFPFATLVTKSPFSTTSTSQTSAFIHRNSRKTKRLQTRTKGLPTSPKRIHRKPPVLILPPPSKTHNRQTPILCSQTRLPSVPPASRPLPPRRRRPRIPLPRNLPPSRPPDRGD